MTQESIQKKEALISLVQEQANTYLKQPLSAGVIAALKKVPREEFGGTWENQPYPIGYGQTISQPFMVAVMTELIYQYSPKHEKVGEIGGGSGYQAAILSDFFDSVITIERHRPLAERAQKVLAKQAINNVTVQYGNGGDLQEQGLDALMVTCGVVGKIPEKWLNSLAEQGVLLLPYAASESEG